MLMYLTYLCHNQTVFHPMQPCMQPVLGITVAFVDSRCCQIEKKNPKVNLTLLTFCILAAKHYNVVTDCNVIDHSYLRLVYVFFPIHQGTIL